MHEEIKPSLLRKEPRSLDQLDEREVKELVRAFAGRLRDDGDFEFGSFGYLLARIISQRRKQLNLVLDDQALLQRIDQTAARTDNTEFITGYTAAMRSPAVRIKWSLERKGGVAPDLVNKVAGIICDYISLVEIESGK